MVTIFDRKLKEYNKKYREKHKEEMRERCKKWRKKNPERVIENRKRWNNNNPDKIKEKTKEWHKNNPEKIKEYNEQYRKNNLQSRRDYDKQYYQTHKEIKNKYNRKRRMDLKISINHKMSVAIGQSLKGNKAGRHWESLVGYTLDNLLKHLKETIPEGYTWQDFLQGKLHIDHIIPISVFNFTKSEHTDFKKCWALDNLRLLLAKENLIKSNKLNKPFQPALSM